MVTLVKYYLRKNVPFKYTDMKNENQAPVVVHQLAWPNTQ